MKKKLFFILGFIYRNSYITLKDINILKEKKKNSFVTTLSNSIINTFQILKLHTEGHPGGPVVKNPPASAWDMGLIPGPGRSHIP